MTRLLLAAVVLAATLIGIAIVPPLLPSISTALLPLTVLAAWGVVRRADEVITAIPAVAVPLGISSEERVGWYLLACVPFALALVALSTIEGRTQRFAAASVAAATGSAAFVLVMLAVGGHAAAIVTEAPSLLASALLAALLAPACTLLLWPWRTRRPGLFA